NNVLYYPNLLMSTAAIATYIIGKGESGLDKRWIYVLPVTLIAMWVAVAVNVIGANTGKWLQNAGGIGTYIPGIILILLGLYGPKTIPAPTEITPAKLIPVFSNPPALNLPAPTASASAGMELVSTMGEEVDHPRRNLPRSVYIAAPLIALAYI